jgi:hypothetical protein
MKYLLLLAAALVPAAVMAAIDSTRYAHPRGDYSLTYPSDWKRSMGLQALLVRPPGPSGKQVSITLESYPLGKDSPATPEIFEKELRADVGRVKKLDSEGTATVAGRQARRLALTMTGVLKTSYGVPLPGPRRELYLILPKEGERFYVLKLIGVGAAFEQSLPEFDRIAAGLTLAKPSAVPVK